MKLPNYLSRREMLAAPALLSLAGGSMALDTSADMRRFPDERTLVAYFSRTGNTRVIAGQVRRALRADLIEIQPAEAYPEDYEETVEQARHERDTGYEPVLKASVPDLAAYKTVFLGFPIWGETTPPVIRSFLSALDLTGKTLIPFITHGGYGLGNSLSVLARYSPKARLLDGFSIQADQERETLSRVTRWLGKIQLND